MFHIKILAVAAIIGSCVIAPAVAQNVAIIQGDTTMQLAASAQAPLRLTPDKSELIRLPRSAASVVVGNPAHISVLAESANTLVIVPRAAGASHFTALDDKGEIILQRHVIVAAPQKDYLRVRRTCTRGDDSCQATSVYYCPDMCHEIAMDQSDTPAGGGQASGASSDSQFEGSAPPSADGS